MTTMTSDSGTSDIAAEDTITSPVKWIESDEGVVTLLLDDPAQKVNTLSTDLIDALVTAIDRLEAEQDRIRGVILRSAKTSFLAGGDLNRLLAITDAGRQEFADDLNFRKANYRRLELYPRPVAAVIDGPAMGGGLELALCCHRRIGAGARAVVGLPEVGLGLIPGAGGIVRCVRRMGLVRALDDVLLRGSPLGLDRARELGLVDQVVDSTEDAIAAALEWIASPPAEMPRTPESVQDAELSAIPQAPGSAVRAREVLVDVAEHSTRMDLDEALRYETDALAGLVVDPRSKNLIRTRFFGTAQLHRRIDRKAPLEAPVGIVATPAAAEALRARLGGAIEVSDAVRVDFPNDPWFDVSDPAGGWTARGWVRPDHVGDGVPVIEIEDYGEPVTRSVFAALRRAGFLVLPLRPGAGSYSARVHARFHSAVEKFESRHRDKGEIVSALRWSGLAPVAGRVDQQSPVGTVEAPALAVARALLDAFAEAAVAAADVLAHPDDIDPASVRIGMPGWTGGARSWSEDGRHLV